MDTCSGTIGLKGTTSTAKKELLKITDDINKTDDAMERLQALYEEYCDQLLQEQKNCSAKDVKI